MLRLTIPVALLVTTSAWMPASGGPASPSLPTRVEGRLSSGLTVTIVHDAAAPAVAILLSFPVGSRDDPGDAPGLAHLAEHLYVRGVPSVDGMFAERAADLGGKAVNGSTDFDRSLFYWTVPAAKMGQALALEAERARSISGTVDQVALDRERAVIDAELREEADTLDAQVKRVAFPIIYGSGHPYAHLPGGIVGGLRGVDLVMVRRRVAQFYTLSNAHMVIVGNVDPEATLTLIGRHLATVPRDPPVAPVRHAVPPMVTTVQSLAIVPGRSKAVTLYTAAPTLTDAASFGLERTVPSLRRALVARALATFGEAAAATLWYSPSERAGNFGLRLVLGKAVAVAEARTFLASFLADVAAGDCCQPDPVPSDGRPSGPIEVAIAIVKGSTLRDEMIAAELPERAVTATRAFFSRPFITILTEGPALPAPDAGTATITIGLPSRADLIPVDLQFRQARASGSDRALRILTAALGGGTGAVLDLALRDERGWSYGLTGEVVTLDAGNVAHVRFRISRDRLSDALGLSLSALSDLATASHDAGRALRRACLTVPVTGASSPICSTTDADIISARSLAASWTDALVRAAY